MLVVGDSTQKTNLCGGLKAKAPIDKTSIPNIAKCRGSPTGCSPQTVSFSMVKPISGIDNPTV